MPRFEQTAEKNGGSEQLGTRRGIFEGNDSSVETGEIKNDFISLVNHQVGEMEL